MIRCTCGGGTKISNTRDYGINSTRRHHRCVQCGVAFYTIESIEDNNLYLELDRLREKLKQIGAIAQGDL